MKEQYWTTIITIIAIVLMGALLWLGARAQWRGMSDSDKMVFGAWSGVMKDVHGNNVEVAYLFWGNGNYTITPASPFGTIYERGIYKTSLVEQDIVSLQLTPDKVTKGAKAFSGLGEPRTLEVRHENDIYTNFLIFPDGTRFVESTLETYSPQVS